MKRYYFLMLFSIITNLSLSAKVTCSPEPIASCTPDKSVLHTLPREFLDYVGPTRTRLSTCTGVIWLEDNKLISIGFHNKSLDTYQFDPLGPSLYALKADFLIDYQSSKLGPLENLDITRDFSIAAISNNGKEAIHLYKVSGVDLTHFSELPKEGGWNHGVHFSRDMDYLAFTVFGYPGKIILYRISKDNNGDVSFEKCQSMNTDLRFQHPKAIDFSIDERFVVVAFSDNNSRSPKTLSGTMATYRFNKKKGKIDPSPVSVINTSGGLSVTEDVWFYPDGSCILVSNQGNDTITIHDFDQSTGEIGESRVLLQNPQAQLSFPHGFCFSPDGKYLAVTNYGDDTVKIYSISNTEQ